MTFTMLQTRTPSEMELLLKGPVTALRRIVIQDGVFDTLNGKTLVFEDPSVTVTFATADPVSVSDALDEINAQVQAVDPNFLAVLVASAHLPGEVPGQKLRMVTSTPIGLTIDLASSTAASRLGFAVTGEISGFPISPFKIVGNGDSISGGLYVIVNGQGAVLQHFTDHSSGAEVTDVLLNFAGELIEAIAISRAASTVYFQLHDRATALSGAEVPKISIPMEVGDRLSLSPLVAFSFDTGIVFGFSTTQDTYTADATGGTVYATFGI